MFGQRAAGGIVTCPCQNFDHVLSTWYKYSIIMIVACVCIIIRLIKTSRDSNDASDALQCFDKWTKVCREADYSSWKGPGDPHQGVQHKKGEYRWARWSCGRYQIRRPKSVDIPTLLDVDRIIIYKKSQNWLCMHILLLVWIHMDSNPFFNEGDPTCCTQYTPSELWSPSKVKGHKLYCNKSWSMLHWVAYAQLISMPWGS